MKKVLITGVAGQIGSHIAEALLARGDQVIGIDNFETGRPYHLPQKDDQFEFVEESIANKDAVIRVLADYRPDVIVHAAASYKDPDNWEQDIKTNVLGSAYLIQEAVKLHIPRFIYFQTALCYGTKPLSSPIPLNHPKNPANSSYAISKTAAEDYLEISGLSFVSFRLANVIGPRNVSGPLPIFFERLKAGKRCFVTKARRDFVYVNDLVPVVLKAIDGVGEGPYHFSSGRDVSIKQLYDAVVNALKITPYPHPEIRPLGEGEAETILLDPSKTFRDFGELNFTPLEEVVAAAVAYYEQYGVAGGYTHLKMEK